MVDFAEFNDIMNMDELSTAIDEAAGSNNVERVKVPFGDYEVKITKLALEKCPFDGDYKDKPQIAIWFKVLNGEFADQMIFMTKRVMSTDIKKTGFVIRIANEFLETLESGVPIAFGGSYNDYAECLEEVFNAIKNAEYHLAYTENEKGFKDYNIIKRFV